MDIIDHNKVTTHLYRFRYPNGDTSHVQHFKSVQPYSLYLAKYLMPNYSDTQDKKQAETCDCSYAVVGNLGCKLVLMQTAPYKRIKNCM